MQGEENHRESHIQVLTVSQANKYLPHPLGLSLDDGMTSNTFLVVTSQTQMAS